MATDIPTRPMRPQTDIEQIYNLLDAARFGDFPNGGDLPPFGDYLMTNVSVDTLAWALHLEAGAPMGLTFNAWIARAGAALNLEERVLGGVDLIALERRRQLQVEGWTAEHDDAHDDEELSVAAACYAVAGLNNIEVVDRGTVDAWPWDEIWDKREQHPRLRRLVIAGALIAAEIDRLLRAGTPLVEAVHGKGDK